MWCLHTNVHLRALADAHAHKRAPRARIAPVSWQCSRKRAHSSREKEQSAPPPNRPPPLLARAKKRKISAPQMGALNRRLSHGLHFVFGNKSAASYTRACGLTSDTREISGMMRPLPVCVPFPRPLTNPLIGLPHTRRN